MKRLLLLITLCCISIQINAQQGNWSGELNIGSTKLELIFKISTNTQNYSTTLSVPAQGLANFDMDSTIYHQGQIRIVSNGLSMVYSGEFTGDGYKGKFSQNGMTFELDLVPANTTKRVQEPIEPLPYQYEEVEFTNRKEGNMLSGTLTIPQNTRKCPAVVLVSGSGAQNRDSEVFGHKIFLVLSDYLTRRGIAVLRYDDRGVGKSESTDNIATSADLAYDAEAAIEYLRDRKEFSSVGVVGHSEGGLIAFMLGGERGYKRPDFIVSLAGPGVSGSEVLALQQRTALENLEIESEKIEAALAINQKLYSIAKESKSLDSTYISSVKSTLLESIPSDMDEKEAQELIQGALSQLTNPWFYFFVKYDPQRAIQRTRVPVIALNGSLDVQVSADQNLPAIESALTRGGNRVSKTMKLDGLNHLFQRATTGDVSEYAEIEETMYEEVMSLIAESILVINRYR